MVAIRLPVSQVVVWAIISLLPTLSCFAKEELRDHLPEFIPKDAIELTPKAKYLLAPDITDTLPLGDLETGRAYYAIIRIVNMSEKPDKIAHVRSSCGCLVAAQAKEMIAPTAESHFLLYIRPEAIPSKFSKAVAVTSENGSSLNLLVTASFVAPYAFSTQQVSLDGNSSGFRVQLVATKFAKPGIVPRVEPVTQLVEVSQVEQAGAANAYDVTGSVSPSGRSALAASPVVIERFLVRDGKNGLPLCELVMQFRYSKAYIVKPSTVRLVLENGEYKGKVFIFGDWRAAPAPQALVCILGTKEKVDGRLTLDRGGLRMAAYNLTLQSDVLLSETKLLTAEIFNNGELICVIERLLLDDRDSANQEKPQ